MACNSYNVITRCYIFGIRLWVFGFNTLTVLDYIKFGMPVCMFKALPRLRLNYIYGKAYNSDLCHVVREHTVM